MPRIEGEYERIRDALDTPTLKLLDRKSAAVAIPLFLTAFPDDGSSVPVERFHQVIDAQFAELRAAGHDAPAVPGKTWAMRCVRERWLYRDPGDGQETYQLTGDAKQALDYVTRATRTQLNVSRSRITTMRDVIARAALAINPDRDAHLARLDEQIAALTSERDRLASGEEPVVASEDELREQFANVLREIDGLSSDFRRVEEAVRAMHRVIVGNLRQGKALVAEVVDDYLDRSHTLIDRTPEGRAFDGALALLRNDQWKDSLRDDLATMLDHPHARRLAIDEERQLRAVEGTIKRGVDEVLAQRHRLSATLDDHIQHYDRITNRELDETLRGIDLQMRRWMRTARPRDHVPLDLLPGGLDVAGLRFRVFDPDSERAPDALKNVTDDAPEPPSLDELRRQGGPHLPELRERLDAQRDTAQRSSAADVFGALPDDLRRPVDLLGLVHLMMGSGAELHTERQEIIETRRPDGTARRFAMPAVTLGPDDSQPVSSPDGTLDDGSSRKGDDDA